jgi:release factor glutamine methyltransferase
MSDIYEPREDTYLVLEEVKRYATGNVLDMGTGSGILAMAAAVKAENVIGVDINPEAVKFAKETAKIAGLKNIQFYQSDLFSFFEESNMKFDLIIFNPPYLPEDAVEPESSRLMTTGGKRGYELIEKFFSQVSSFLMPYGNILIVFSSLTGKEKIHEIMERYAFSFQKLAEESFFAETIFVYVASKSRFLRELEFSGITSVERINKGHRGLIFRGYRGEKTVVIKKQREDIDAIGRMENEARWLKVLNRKGIAPKIIHAERDYFIYEYVDGEFLPQYMKTANKKEIKRVLKEVFRQCFVLDQIGINKEEMHNPYKHIIIEKKTNKPVLIDFERAHVTEAPKNVTQFCQYISSTKVGFTLKEKGIKIDKRKLIAACQRYKKNMKKQEFNDILKLIN